MTGNLRFRGGEIQPVAFEEWVRALANELKIDDNSYTFDTPGSFSEAAALLISDHALAPGRHGYPALYLLPTGGTFDDYLTLIYESAFRGNAAETQVYEDGLHVYVQTYPDEDYRDVASFVGIVDDSRSARLVLREKHIYVRELAATDVEDLRRIYERVRSAATKLA